MAIPIGAVAEAPAAGTASGARSAANGAADAPGQSSASSIAPADFADVLGKAVQAVNGSTNAANTAVQHMLDGTTDVHEAMIALQHAENTFELTVQVRNKLLQAYQEVMRMTV